MRILFKKKNQNPDKALSFLVSGSFWAADNKADMAESKNHTTQKQFQNGTKMASIALIIKISFKEVEPEFLRILNFIKKHKKGLKKTQTNKTKTIRVFLSSSRS